MRVAGWSRPWGRCAALALALVACKDAAPSKAKVDPEAAAKAAQEQRDLLARRDELVKNRAKLKAEAEALEQQIRDGKAQGQDTSELEKRRTDLETQRTAEDDKLVSSMTELSDRLAAVGAVAGGGDGAELAQVMAKLSARDAQVGELTSQMGTMVKELAALRAEVTKQAEACGAAAAAGPTIITTGGDVKATKYGRADVEGALKKARDVMSKKGIRSADLADDYEREATKAMGESDYGAAYFAASALLKVVERTKIDAGFVTAKMNRIGGKMKGKTVADDVRDLFFQAQKLRGDGKFDEANSKLNQLEKQL
jgi:hypothetical protein